MLHSMMAADDGRSRVVWLLHLLLHLLTALAPRCELLAARSLMVVGAGRCPAAACRSRPMALLYLCALHGLRPGPVRPCGLSFRFSGGFAGPAGPSQGG